jgi:hypothetical protein
LKKVEIVIIKINKVIQEREFEAKSAESFGKSTTHILCALYACCDEFLGLVFSIYNLHSNQFNFTTT